MNDEPSLYENIRRIQSKLEEQYNEKGIETEYRNNWQGENELFFKRNGEWYSSSACIKLAMALSLPDTSYKHIKKKLNNNEV